MRLQNPPNGSEEHLPVPASSGTGVVTTCRKSCPYHKKIEEVIRAIPTRAEARCLLAHG